MSAWMWLVRKTRDSKPFFFAFATVCGVVPGVIGYCVMQLTSSRNEHLEAKLRQNARPDSLVTASSFPFSLLLHQYFIHYNKLFIFVSIVNLELYPRYYSLVTFLPFPFCLLLNYYLFHFVYYNNLHSVPSYISFYFLFLFQ